MTAETTALRRDRARATFASVSGAWQARRPRLARVVRREAPGLAVALVAVGLIMVFSNPEIAGAWPTGRDALCYWAPAIGDPYAQSEWTAPLAYVYSPAFIQALAPLKALPWLGFLAAWAALLLAAIRFLSGARLFALAIVVSAIELGGGNIHLLLAAAIVAGFRWPAAWSLVLLTKVTPGIGLLWFLVRSEWRNLAVALGATGAVVLVSLAIDPLAWLEWFGVLTASVDKTTGTWSAVAVPLWVRLPIAVAVVTWGARTDRRWTVPVAAMLALPALWFGSLSMLIAIVALRRPAVVTSVPGEPPGSSGPLPGTGLPSPVQTT